MATTATNKQPLLVDRVFHAVVDLTDSLVNTISFTGANTAALMVNGINTDGLIIEDIYSIATGATPVTINLYFSRSQDYLRPTEGIFIGQFTSGSAAGERTEFEGMPKILSPMPHTSQAGDEQQFRALYVPRGLTVWAGIEAATSPTYPPILGMQGGYY